ncbi:hypothetical protein ACU635_35135 [[Actinomadura] parvosata]|uniref:hypothetical protein n=1 Tax=[Actinomadura] parvosata TaxID=1955412 RepID=UPI00406CC65F
MNRLLRVMTEGGADHVMIFWEHESVVGDRDLHADGAIVAAQATVGVVAAQATVGVVAAQPEEARLARQDQGPAAGPVVVVVDTRDSRRSTGR